MVKTPHSQCRGMGLVPGWETKILHATVWPKKKTAENRGGNYCFFLVCGHIYLHSPGNEELAETQARDQTMETNPGSLFVFVDKLVLHSFPIPHLSYLKN